MTGDFGMWPTHVASANNPHHYNMIRKTLDQDWKKSVSKNY